MKGARHILILAVCCLAFFCLKAQKNLIINGGMEDTVYCSPSGANNIQQFIGWYNPTINGSMAYHKCCYAIPTAPKPRNGWGCASAFSYISTSTNSFNYVAGHFSKPLEAGKQYCFSMYVRLWYYYKRGSNNLALYIEKAPIFYNTGQLVSTTPVLTIPFTVVDSIWVSFKGIYTATGGETDFMIGGYMPYSSANYPLIFPNGQQDYSEFVYDDFSLIEITSASLGTDKTICNKSDSVLLGDSAWAETKYKWYENGTLIDTVHSQIKVKPIVTTSYVLVQENCNISSDTVVIKVIDDCSNLSDGVYASNVFTPNGDNLNDTFKVFIENGTIQNATIYNRWGNLVYQSGISGTHYFLWDGHTTSGETCNPGTYYYVISYTNSQQEPKTLKGFVSLFQ